jgi:hypothetical protein
MSILLVMQGKILDGSDNWCTHVWRIGYLEAVFMKPFRGYVRAMEHQTLR